MSNNVISLARIRAAKTVQSPVLLSPLHSNDAIQLQARIENALSMALYHVRCDACGSLHAAMGRALRALSLIKQACADEKSTVQEG